MPRMVPQHLKSLTTINLQPDKMTPKTRVIMYLDVGGMTNKKISETVGMTEGRVSIIRNCPMYKQQRDELEASTHIDRHDLPEPSDRALRGLSLASLLALQLQGPLEAHGSEGLDDAGGTV